MSAPRDKHNPPNRLQGFDVTCVIGSVVFDAMGDMTPVEAAYLLIARHGAPGSFEFPQAEGGTHRVIVEYDTLNGDPADD